MAAPVDLSSLNLNTQEALNISECIFEKYFVEDDSKIKEAHEIHTGVQMDTQIPIFGRMGLVGQANNNCTPNTVSAPSATEKKYEPKLIDWRLAFCMAEIPQLFKLWKRAAKALETWELIESEEMAYITDTSVNAGLEMILRLTSLGDTSASPIGDGTGDETLTSGTDKTFFNILNGFWNQIVTAVTAGTVTRHTIPENGYVSKALQMELADDRAIETFRYLYNNADSRLIASGEAIFEVTHSLFLNWQDYLEDKSLNFSLQRAEEGSNKWNYRGVPIIIRYDWDRNIQAYYDNGTTYYLPHRAWLSTKSNMVIATSDESDINSFSTHFDQTTKMHYIDQAIYLDAKLLEEDMIIVAY